AVAFDADADGETAAHVEECRRRLAAAAVEHGYAVRFARWEAADGKGIDDVLIGGRTFTLERYTPVSIAVSDTESAPVGSLAEQLHAANFYITWLAQILGHQAMITPHDDVSAK